MAIDWDKPLRLRNGAEYRLYARDGSGPYPVHGAYLMDDCWLMIAHTKGGKYLDNTGGFPQYDLVNVPEEHTAWRDGDGLEESK